MDEADRLKNKVLVWRESCRKEWDESIQEGKRLNRIKESGHPSCYYCGSYKDCQDDLTVIFKCIDTLQ